MELKPTTKVAEALAVAQRAAQTAGHAEITPAHLALALAEQEGTTTSALLTAAGTSAEGVAATARGVLGGMPRSTGADRRHPRARSGRARGAPARHDADDGPGRHAPVHRRAAAGPAREGCGPGRREGPRGSGSSTCAPAPRSPARTPRRTGEALATYGTDLTQAARDGRLDPVIGRDDEIRRVVQVL